MACRLCYRCSFVLPTLVLGLYRLAVNIVSYQKRNTHCPLHYIRTLRFQRVVTSVWRSFCTHCRFLTWVCNMP
ncbi:uncharacterized protein BJ212DRAFT_1316400 [Suillus subaureus]|uniref:Uncharacterized protein n=1 Tax=Suillus subaureus TaxID=48587 RepID=A0A9P7ELY8_9AGAM|nr:uncharacterized protein BJ212DRAFT_1316400 [Suillus subaureus]KAG1825831.1 hypothetical protein BJ212DRAFT_1316400 [Suillus subaureus]